MARHKRRRPDTLGEREHRIDANVSVADHARVRGAARAIAVDEGADDLSAKLLLQVEREVRDPELVRDAASAQHRQRRAAALGRVRSLVGPQLHRDGDDVGAAVALRQRGDRRIDTAAQRHEHAVALPRRVSELAARCCETGERAV